MENEDSYGDTESMMYNKNLKDCNNYKYFQRMQFEDLGSDRAGQIMQDKSGEGKD